MRSGRLLKQPVARGRTRGRDSCQPVVPMAAAALRTAGRVHLHASVVTPESGSTPASSPPVAPAVIEFATGARARMTGPVEGSTVCADRGLGEAILSPGDIGT